ncbi:sulfite exporter TauE/SafE family protein [bacterium]|nr:sulfite exporter TauE/SafE family protein [bacterium]
MDYLIICLTAIFVSGLTLFSGFGLGTLLLPAFAFFFPLDVSVGLTAIVHFANNIFKLVLLGKHADKSVVLKFGLPAILFAFLGAKLLFFFSGLEPFATYTFLQKSFKISLVGVVIAFVMIFFAVFEALPKFQKLNFDKKFLPLGGILSGFFGGFSGHQGALRSAFLVRLELSKESFIATGVVIACLIDFTRILVYSEHFKQVSDNFPLLLAATVSAFSGTFIGNKLVKKITMKSIQIIVSVMLFVIAILIGTGII